MSARSTRPLLLLAPLLAAWTTGGSGQATWSDGTRARITSVSVVAHGDPAEFRAVLSFRDGEVGDALIHLRVPQRSVGLTLDLAVDHVGALYVAYGPDGDKLFEEQRPLDGEVSILPRGDRWVMRLSGRWSDGETIRALHGLTVWLDAPGEAHGEDYTDDTYDTYDRPSTSTGGGVTIHGGSNSGCDNDDWESEDDGWSDDSGGGCEGDDWGDDDDWDDDSSGGCEGDGLGDSDSDWGDDSGGGCEGDDVGDSGGTSCEGDAVAAGNRPRRSPTIVRLINQLPWMLVLVGIRLVRRRERR